MVDFITVFEISKNNNSLLRILFVIGLIVLTLGIGGLILRKTNQSIWSKRLFPPLFLIIWGLVMSLLSIQALERSSCKANELFSAYLNKQYKISEGLVHVLHQQAYYGHDKGDLIKIDGQELEINYFSGTTAYSKTLAHGGVLKEGAYARIYHHDEKILRIDMRNDALEHKKSAEHSDGQHTGNEKARPLEITWKDYIWTMWIVAANLFFFIRKFVLFQHGYEMGLTDYTFRDWGRLKVVIERETVPAKRLLYRALNLSVSLSFLIGILCFILIRTIFRN